MGFFDNERYLLSALVQSLAATIALVITLSLVAVQLAAQSYSARVIEVYKKNPDMWILLCIYIFTIFYGLGLTKIIGLGILGNYMEGAIFVAYFMGFFAFVCLVPYMLKTLDLLKPSTVIKLLAEDVTKEKILDSLKDDVKIAEKDPVQPIFDMINGAFRRNDYETVRNGIKAIADSTINTYETNYFEYSIQNDEEYKFRTHILDYFNNIEKSAINSRNEDSAKSIIYNLGRIGEKTAEREMDWSAAMITRTLINFGNEAAELEIESIVVAVVESLGKIGSKIKEKELKLTKKNIDIAFEDFNKIAKKNEWDNVWQEIMIADYNMGNIKI